MEKETSGNWKVSVLALSVIKTLHKHIFKEIFSNYYYSQFLIDLLADLDKGSIIHGPMNVVTVL